MDMSYLTISLLTDIYVVQISNTINHAVMNIQIWALLFIFKDCS
jgi:hypothetical protein